MKKILCLLLGMIFYFAGINCANALEDPIGITFIYINGSNNLSYKNRDKFRVAFESDVKELHPQIKKRFEKDELINETFLENGKYVINPEPITFYWGNRSLKVVETIDKDLASAKKYSPIIAHQARSIFAHCLHDAVWVQKHHNMINVLDDLHKVVTAETQKGNKVVLLGYSAGSFVTYQYYMNKSNSITPYDVAKGNYGEDFEQFMASNPVNPTCFDALVEADLVRYNPQTGLYSPNPEIEIFKKNYLGLNKVTETACFVGGTVKGVVGFASPARLFYSDLMNKETSLSRISQMMAKSVIENDVFYLTVNYSNDPFGFSNAENFTQKFFTETSPIFINNFKGGNGFFYNKSDNYVPRTFITAHLAYWSTPKRFSKAIVKAYNEGYKNFKK